MSWLERADEEIKIRSLLDRVGDPEAKTYVTRGEVVSVDRVFGRHGNLGRCEIRFLDRPYGGDVDAPLEEQTIRTDWLDAAGWQGEVAREIERRATAAIGRRVLIHQLNEHAEGEMSDKGFRRVVWLEVLQERAAPAAKQTPAEHLDPATKLRRRIVDLCVDLTPKQRGELKAWAIGGGFPDKFAAYSLGELERAHEQIREMLGDPVPIPPAPIPAGDAPADEQPF